LLIEHPTALCGSLGCYNPAAWEKRA
jgi:hypothetical protein